MVEALYRKYRPSTFEDVVGQEHIERTLKNALTQEKVSHAYLFCGPRGTGKTTMARILAKALLCQKAPTVDPDGTCEECELIAAGTHPDVYELDAASRTGVENVREEIINRVHYAPTRGSYKIYIIDEVHMLSTAAFNALLKTLEEPPSHVVFILCTTDPQKVPDTIHSRCQRFDFHRLSVDEIVARLGAVCVQEGVEFDPEALELIAHQAGGGMRNALTSLEQLAAFGEGKVTLEGAHSILGTLDDEGLFEIVDALGRHDAAACFTWVSRYVETGADVAQFVQDLAEHMRNLYLLSLTDADVEISVSSSARVSMESELELFGPERLSRALGVLGDLMKELRATSNSRLAFEIALTRLLRPESDLTMEALAERLEALELKMLSAPSAAVVAPAQQAGSQPVVASRAVAPSVPSEVSPMPAPQPAPAPQPTPAPQPVPVPQPTPAPQSTPAPQPAPAVSQVAQAQQMAQPFTQTASSIQADASASQSTAAPQQPVAPASFDYSNAAALQRMWSQVTSALRKASTPRGALFMGTKIEADPQNGGVRIVFSPDSNFVFSRAQNKEVKDLLAQAFVEVTGGSVPFQLVMGQGSTANVPSASFQQASASVPQQPVAPAVVPPSATAQPQESSRSSQAAFGMTAAPTPYEDESPFFDEVPLEAYDPAPAQAASQPSVRSAPSTSDFQQAAPTQPQQTTQPAAPQPAAIPSSPLQVPADSSAQSVACEADAPASDESLSESDQIKQILTASFGDGVKFDTM